MVQVVIIKGRTCGNCCSCCAVAVLVLVLVLVLVGGLEAGCSNRLTEALRTRGGDGGDCFGGPLHARRGDWYGGGERDGQDEGSEMDEGSDWTTGTYFS